MAENKFRLVLAAVTENLQQVISFIEESIQNTDHSPKTVIQITIAVEEIFVNIAHYAYPEKNGEAIVTGVKMVHDDFLKVLDKNGVKKIDAVHKPFDPKFHEAVAFVPTDEFPPNTVMVELKAGFTLHERVVRAAQVVLASAPVKPAEPQPEN